MFLQKDDFRNQSNISNNIPVKIRKMAIRDRHNLLRLAGAGWWSIWVQNLISSIYLICQIKN